MPGFSAALPLPVVPPPSSSRQLRTQFLAAADAYAEPLFRHCYCRLLDRERGKEAVEETLVRAWNAMRDGSPMADMRTLLYRFANATVQDFRHGMERAARVAVTEPPLIEALRSLSDDQRDAIVMRYVDGLDTKDIANIMRVSGSLIAARLRGGAHIFLSLHRYV